MKVKTLFKHMPLWRALYNELGPLFEVQRFIVNFKFHYTEKSFEELLKQRLNHLREELNELETAIEEKDEYQVWDALVDILYIAAGAVFLIQMPFKKVFRRVHKANMEKVACETIEESKRQELPDCYKPEGWEEPNFEDIEKVGIFDLQED